jgi:Dr1-associated corepressor
MMDEEYVPETKARSRKAAGKRKSQAEAIAAQQALAPLQGEPRVKKERIDVKTKFPVARIKRIMQADEDVGKVAQVTPVIVCKSPPPSF